MNRHPKMPIDDSPLLVPWSILMWSMASLRMSALSRRPPALDVLWLWVGGSTKALSCCKEEFILSLLRFSINLCGVIGWKEFWDHEFQFAGCFLVTIFPKNWVLQKVQVFYEVQTKTWTNNFLTNKSIAGQFVRKINNSTEISRRWLGPDLEQTKCSILKTWTKHYFDSEYVAVYCE